MLGALKVLVQHSGLRLLRLAAGAAKALVHWGSSVAVEAEALPARTGIEVQGAPLEAFIGSWPVEVMRV